LDEGAVSSVAVADQKSTGEQPAGLGSEPVSSKAGPRSSAAGGGVSLVSSSAVYKIGATDVLEFSVFKVPELSRTVQVSDTGTVNLPLVGEVVAAGRTARELEQSLAKELGAKYLQKPQVSIYVKEYNSQRVTIEGAVKKPGVYPVRGDLTLLQLVATAQGFEQNSDYTVVVFRQKDGKRSAARFDVEEIRAGRAQDPLLLSGDVVVAGSSAIKETFNNILKALPIAGVFAML
jgi:polysaccharide export outer membrane protein